MTHRKKALKNLVDEYLQSGLFTHCYLAFVDAHHGCKSLSEYEYLPQGRDIFDCASLTKALVMAPLTYYVLQKNNLALTTRLGELVQPQEKGWEELFNLTVEEILRHRSGLPPWKNFYVHELHKEHLDLWQRLTRGPLKLGDKTERYSDVGFILLGYVIEKFCQLPLDQLWKQFCEKELNFILAEYDIGFAPHLTKEQKSRAVPTSYCALRQRQLIAEVHDENAWALGGVCGHAGLFASGEALKSYLCAFVHSQLGQDFLNANAAYLQTSDQYLLGWQLGSQELVGDYAQGQAMGHLGFTGTAFWVHRVAETFVIVLTNRVISSRRPPAAMKMFRQKAVQLLVS